MIATLPVLTLFDSELLNRVSSTKIPDSNDSWFNNNSHLKLSKKSTPTPAFKNLAIAASQNIPIPTSTPTAGP